ncbi:MAG: DUF99 family protein [Pseudomonadota bacterium]|nr:DUF99 family protein [Pseudomonadota bacterium]
MIRSAPFDKQGDTTVAIAGVVCAGTRFEGLLWGRATRDGTDATDVLAGMLLGSKFHAQVHVVLLDGIAVGGGRVPEPLRLAHVMGAVNRFAVAWVFQVVGSTREDLTSRRVRPPPRTPPRSDIPQGQTPSDA